MFLNDVADRWGSRALGLSKEIGAATLRTEIDTLFETLDTAASRRHRHDGLQAPRSGFVTRQGFTYGESGQVIPVSFRGRKGSYTHPADLMLARQSRAPHALAPMAERPVIEVGVRDSPPNFLLKIIPHVEGAAHLRTGRISLGGCQDKGRVGPAALHLTRLFAAAKPGNSGQQRNDFGKLMPTSSVEAIFHLETAANLLELLERLFSLFSKCDLKSLNNQADFDSAIRRFDPSRPSHPFLRSARLPKRRENGPEIPAFCAFDFVSGLPLCRT